MEKSHQNFGPEEGRSSREQLIITRIPGISNFLTKSILDAQTQHLRPVGIVMSVGDYYRLCTENEDKQRFPMYERRFQFQGLPITIVGSPICELTFSPDDAGQIGWTQREFLQNGNK